VGLARTKFHNVLVAALKWRHNANIHATSWE